MAGCFGNHPIDRYMENQLYRYLDQCDDDEALFEKFCEVLPDEDWNRFEDYVNHIYDKYISPRLLKNRMSIQQGQTLMLRMINLKKQKDGMY